MAELTVVETTTFSTHAIDNIREKNGNTPSLPVWYGSGYHGNGILSQSSEMRLGPYGFNAEQFKMDGDRAHEEGELKWLLARIHDGDEDAARELLRRYEARVRLVVRRQLPRLLRSRFDS